MQQLTAHLTVSNHKDDADETTSTGLSLFLAVTTLNPSALFTSTAVTDIMIDPGATHTMVHDEALLSSTSTLARPVTVMVGNGAKIHATKLGTLTIGSISITETLLFPGVGRNLFSVYSTTSVAPDARWASTPNSALFQNGDTSHFHAEFRTTSIRCPVRLHRPPSLCRCLPPLFTLFCGTGILDSDT